MTSAKKAPPASDPASMPESSISFSASHLANQFLVAMPGMVDPNFLRSVIYLFEHTERGAMGLVVNRPTELDLGTLFDKIELKLNIKDILAQDLIFFQDLNGNRKYDIVDNKWQQVNFGQTVSLSFRYKF